MAKVQFLSNASMWHVIESRVHNARRVHAAIAYFGDTGAKLLPLKRGDRLIVDMSLAAVKQGVTDPDEIRKLRKRGVEVFTRSCLHAKFIIADNTLISGSANVSKNSQNVLDEAAILTTDPAAVRRARALFDQWCTEPVRDRYLDECIAAYKPPTFKAAAKPRSVGNKQRRHVEAKLWFIGGITALYLSEKESEPIEAVEERAEAKLKHPDATIVDWVRYATPPQFFRSIRVGDWVVICMKDGSRRDVYAPAQVLGTEHYKSSRGKHYTMLLLEAPNKSEPMSLSQFRRKVRARVPKLGSPNPRSRPIIEQDAADAILRLWTPSGRVSTAKR